MTVRVLLADDDREYRAALAEQLCRAGHAEVVGTASDGNEAVALYRSLVPDVVLMDVVMPACDGIEATRRILELDPDARILALTGGEDHRALALCLAAGARGCLRKDMRTLAPLMLALAADPGSTPSGRQPWRRGRSVMSAHARGVGVFALTALAGT